MEFNYKIEKRFGVVTESGDYATEVNLISYNGAPAKLDIRSWNRMTDRMGKGITIPTENIGALIGILVAAAKDLEEGHE